MQTYQDRQYIAEKYAKMQLENENKALQENLNNMFKSIRDVYDENAEELGTSFIEKLIVNIKSGATKIATTLKDVMGGALSQAMMMSGILKTHIAKDDSTSLLKNLISTIKSTGSKNFDIYLDGDLLVGGITDGMNTALGSNYSLDERGVMA